MPSEAKIVKISVRIWKKDSTRDLVSQHVKKLCLQSQVSLRRWKLLLSHRRVNLIKTWRRSNISVKLKQTVRSTIAKKLITQLVPVQLTNQTFSSTNFSLPHHRSVNFCPNAVCYCITKPDHFKGRTTEVNFVMRSCQCFWTHFLKYWLIRLWWHGFCQKDNGSIKITAC